MLVSACIASSTDAYSVIQITPGFDGQPWQMELFHRISEPMGPQKAAEYVTERYLLDHPQQLLTIGRHPIAQLVRCVLDPKEQAD